MAPFFETQSQAWVFLGMVYLGLGLGFVYDGLGLLRRSGKKGWTVGTDLLFFLLAGASLTLALIITGQDELRIYALLGLVCGGIVYLLGIRRLISGIIAFFKKRIVEPIKQAMARVRERKESRKSEREGRKQA
jgi:hypothetical protein